MCATGALSQCKVIRTFGDINDEVTKSHMPPVLTGLSQQLAIVERALSNPGVSGHGTARLVKVLRMMAKRMCQPQGR